MNTMDMRILEVMASSNPPKSIAALTGLCGSTRAYTNNRVTVLLNSGRLLPEQIPWRLIERPGTYHTVLKPRIRGGPLADLESELEFIIKQNGSDRVSAIRELRELRTMGDALSGPPQPNDTKSMLSALSQILRAAGRDALEEATALAWPPEAQEAPPDLAESTPGGDRLD